MKSFVSLVPMCFRNIIDCTQCHPSVENKPKTACCVVWRIKLRACIYSKDILLYKFNRLVVINCMISASNYFEPLTARFSSFRMLPGPPFQIILRLLFGGITIALPCLHKLYYLDGCLVFFGQIILIGFQKLLRWDLNTYTRLPFFWPFPTIFSDNQPRSPDFELHC